MKGIILFQVSSFLIAAFLALVLLVPDDAAGHGMIMDPPGRSSMWRFDYDVPPNYNDNSLYCGGKGIQYNAVNQGRCGECGDDWSLPRPRENDEGGVYGKGIIGKNYTQGDQSVKLKIQITASHFGHFEFRLCADKKSVDELVTQECLDKHLLKLEDGTTEFQIPTLEAKDYYPVIQLPADVNCEFCVLQWTYHTANSWGICPNGTQATGCGDQETFVNCADIAIRPLS